METLPDTGKHHLYCGTMRVPNFAAYFRIRGRILAELADAPRKPGKHRPPEEDAES